jgi:hypothetical protein
MSTPVAELPTNKASSTGIPDDPEVLNVLQEMEQEVHVATKANAVSMPHPPPPPQPMMQMAMHIPQQPVQIQYKTVQPANKWINKDAMQHAGLIAIAALLVFHPSTLGFLYSSVPKLAFLESYDLFVRGAVLAVLVYVIIIQFGM